MIRRGEDFFQVYILARLAQQLSALEGQCGKTLQRLAMRCSCPCDTSWKEDNTSLSASGSLCCGWRELFALPRPPGSAAWQEGCRQLSITEAGKPAATGTCTNRMLEGEDKRGGEYWRKSVLSRVKINYANCFEAIISFGFVMTESRPLKYCVSKWLQPGLSDLAFKSWSSS